MDVASPNKIGITASLVTLGQSIDWNLMPDDVRHAAKRHLLDTVGAMIAGLSGNVAGAVSQMQTDAGQNGFRVPGSRLMRTPLDIAYLCGTAAHSLELDDGYRPGSVHAGVAVVPALIAACGLKPTSGKTLLAALVAGYETICALSEAFHPALRDRGFHPTSAVGPFGAAMAVARMRGQSEALISNTLGLAASEAGGLFAFLDGGGDVKRLHGGIAARAGLQATLLAEKGILAPSDIIERPSGFAQAFAGVYPGAMEALVLPPARWRMTECYIKPYACCRHLHPALEALISLRDEHGLTPDNVKSIKVETYSIAAKHAATGWQDMASAQLSFPYVMALGLEFGSGALRLFEDETRNSGVAERIAPLLSFEGTAEMDALYPANRPARVSIETDKGRFIRFQKEAMGSAEIPVSDEALRTKFLDLVAPVMGNDAASRLHDGLWALEELADTTSLFAGDGQ